MPARANSNGKTGERIFIAIDIGMVFLLAINLIVISFDWIFSLSPVDAFFAGHVPAFYDFYKSYIHAHFLRIDLVFVAIFLAEFCIGWIVAIGQKTYHKWFFYPFVHWYDLVGCIPLNAFRIVRLLRIFTIIYRLHRLGAIAVDQTYLYRKARKYYEILLEEISDRVVENIIDQMQNEVRHSGPTLESIVDDVLRPKQTLIVDWFSGQLSAAAELNFNKRKHEIRMYVEHTIAASFHKNKDVIRIEAIPMAGKALTSSLQRAIVDIVYNIVENALNDLASSRNRVVVEEATEIVFHAMQGAEGETGPKDIILEIMVEILEIIKKQVSHTKRWKEKDLQEKQQKEQGAVLEEQGPA